MNRAKEWTKIALQACRISAGVAFRTERLFEVSLLDARALGQ
jgi:hypothetical protein